MSTWKFSTPTPRQHMPLVYATRAVCLNLPLFLVCSPPTLPPLACTQAPDSLRDFSCPGTSVSLVSFFILPCALSLLGIFWYLDYQLGVHFCVRERGQGASTPCQLLAPVPAPMLLGHVSAVWISDPPPRNSAGG